MRKIKKEPYIIGLILYVATWIYAWNVYNTPFPFISYNQAAAVVILIITTFLFAIYNFLVFAYHKSKFKQALLLVLIIIALIYFGWFRHV